VLINVIGFQCGWFACVLGAAHGWPWAGTAAGGAIVAAHVLRAGRPLEELKLAAATVCIGALWDSALVSLGWVRFASGTFAKGVAPGWILALWALFATTLNVSLAPLKTRRVLAASLGAVAAPLSYWGGARLGALTFVEPAAAAAALAAGWAAMMPLLLALAVRCDGVRAQALNGGA